MKAHVCVFLYECGVWYVVCGLGMSRQPTLVGPGEGVGVVACAEQVAIQCSTFADHPMWCVSVSTGIKQGVTVEYENKMECRQDVDREVSK